jgi:hypothetical protein
VSAWVLASSVRLDDHGVVGSCLAQSSPNGTGDGLLLDRLKAWEFLRSISSSVSTRMPEIARSRNHLWFDGITYQGACVVLVFLAATYPKPILVRVLREAHPHQLIARLLSWRFRSVGAVGLVLDQKLI